MKTNKLSKLDILSLVIGSIIGWGAFTLPGNTFLPKSGIINTVFGITLGAISIIIIQKSYIYLARENNNIDGGEFVYVNKNLGKMHSFIVGWSLVLCYIALVPLNATAFVLVFKTIFKDSFNFMYLYTISNYDIYLSDIIVAWIIIAFFAYINIKGVKLSALVQNVLIIFLVINVIVIATIMFQKADYTAFYNNYILNETISIKKLSPVVAVIPFLFVGFNIIVQMSSELGISVTKGIKLGIIGIITGASIYILLNIVTGLCYSGEVAFQKEWALGEAVLENIGLFGFSLLIIALLAAVTGGINGFMLSGSKLVGTLSEYNMIPKKYSIKNSKNVYQNAIYFISFISALGPFFGRNIIGYVVDMCSILAALTYAYICFIAIKKAQTTMDKFLVILGLIISIAFILLLILPFSPGRLSGASIIFLIVWIILGIFYYISNLNKK